MQQCKARLVQGFEALLASFLGQVLAIQKDFCMAFYGVEGIQRRVRRGFCISIKCLIDLFVVRFQEYMLVASFRIAALGATCKNLGDMFELGCDGILCADAAPSPSTPYRILYLCPETYEPCKPHNLSRLELLQKLFQRPL